MNRSETMTTDTERDPTILEALQSLLTCCEELQILPAQCAAARRAIEKESTES